MADQEKILGTTKVTNQWRISLIKDVRDELESETDEVDIGDRIVYKLRDGDVVVELA